MPFLFINAQKLLAVGMFRGPNSSASEVSVLYFYYSLYSVLRKNRSPGVS